MPRLFNGFSGEILFNQRGWECNKEYSDVKTAICGLIFNFQNLPDLRSSPDQISPKHNTIQSIYIYPARLLLKVNCNFMVHFEQIKNSKSQQTLTCPKLTINILQKGVKNV